MPEPRLIELKLGLRTWRIAVQDSAGPKDLELEEADLLFVRSEALAPESLSGLLRQSGWSAGTLPAEEARRLDSVLDGDCLVLGPSGFLRRFLAHFAETEPEPASEAGSDRQGPTGQYPDLPDPADVPRFAEEGSLDPFAQDRRVQWAAWSSMADRMIRVVDRVHDHGLAVSLPPMPRELPGMIDPRLKPWRTLVRLGPEGEEDPVWPPPGPVREVGEDDILWLFQRCLLSTAEVGPDDEEGLEDLACLAEGLGFLSLSRSIRFDALPTPLQFMVCIGEFAATIHSLRFLYGDFHPGNFSFDPEGPKVYCFDATTFCFLNRPLTAQERAADLAMLKAQCRFEYWEAVKMGYRAAAGEAAQEVLDLL